MSSVKYAAESPRRYPPSSLPPGHPHQHQTHRRALHIDKGVAVLSADEQQHIHSKQSFFQRLSSSAPAHSSASRCALAAAHPTNRLKSSRYTLVTFLPLNLYEQLSPWNKPANFYFLCIAILQSIQSISTTNGRPSILIPLLFVLIITAIKDALEDHARARSDKAKNEQSYARNDGKWHRVQSQHVVTGDIIKVEEGQRVPADVLLIGSGLDKGTHVFIDTKDLDGETNLKPKLVASSIFSGLSGHVSNIPKLVAELSYEMPNGHMSQWSGDISIGGTRQNLTLDNLILSDCVLRNTPYLLGLVVYTGKDSKLHQNTAHTGGKHRIKETEVFKLTKRFFLLMASLQFLLCLSAGIASGFLQGKNQTSDWYLQYTDSPFLSGFQRVFTWFILCKDFVPISLYVSMELVQFWQAMFMGWDLAMSVEITEMDRKGLMHTSTQFAKVQSSKLNEELAQVSYIFSDKTGTLTQNSMEFKKCVIGSEQYGSGTTEAGVIRRAKKEGADIATSLKQYQAQLDAERAERIKKKIDKFPHVDFNEHSQLKAALEKKDEHSNEIHEFLLAMALNNAVFPKVDLSRSGAPDKSFALTVTGSATLGKTEVKRDPLVIADEDYIAGSAASDPHASDHHLATQYNLHQPTSRAVMALDSSSPDEKALAYFAQYMGYELFTRAAGKTTVRVAQKGHPAYFLEYLDVCTIDFTSKRKRMTILLQPLDAEGKPLNFIQVFCKGADSFVHPLLYRQDPQAWDHTSNYLQEFGGESLRCLIIASSTKQADWWFDPQNGWKHRYDAQQRLAADTDKGHTDGSCGDHCQMCEIEREIELSAHMSLIGATAIEDQLQVGVGATLKTLLEAQIKVFVLTGDTVSTSINIGISCNLFQADMEKDGRLFVLDKDLSDAGLQALGKAISTAMTAVKSKGSDKAYGLAMHSEVWKLLLSQSKHHQALEGKKVTGARLNNTEGDLLDQFFELVNQCRSIVACRLEPKQKAQIVTEMKRRTNVCCLAIGDGCNDVMMIKAADVGVGIRGVEGTSAVANADVAISQFRFLHRLLFVYGHLNYRRISTLINYIFYKTSILVWTVYLFGCYSLFSGQTLFLDWSFQLYNIAFTALPIIIFAVLDREFETTTLENNPEIYALTRGPSFFSPSIFAKWIGFGLLHSLICFFLPLYAFYDDFGPSGLNAGFWTVGLVIWSCVCAATNIKLCFHIKSWNKLYLIGFGVSVLSFWIAHLVFNASLIFSIGGGDYYGVLFYLFGLPKFWLVLLLTVTACFMFDIIDLMWCELLKPSPLQVWRERERLGLIAKPAPITSSATLVIAAKPTQTLEPVKKVKPLHVHEPSSSPPSMGHNRVHPSPTAPPQPIAAPANSTTPAEQEMEVMSLPPPTSTSTLASPAPSPLTSPNKISVSVTSPLMNKRPSLDHTNSVEQEKKVLMAQTIPRKNTLSTTSSPPQLNGDGNRSRLSLATVSRAVDEEPDEQSSHLISIKTPDDIGVLQPSNKDTGSIPNNNSPINRSLASTPAKESNMLSSSRSTPSPNHSANSAPQTSVSKSNVKVKVNPTKATSLNPLNPNQPASGNSTSSLPVRHIRTRS